MVDSTIKPKKIWGAAVWVFFHTLIEKINDEKYAELNEKMFFFIYRICGILPCSACSIPATNYLNKLDFKPTLSSKNDFRKMLLDFHNFVNIKTNAEIFPEKNLIMYAENDIMTTYQNLLKSVKPKVYIEIPYNKRHAKIRGLLEGLEKWLNENQTAFL